MAHGGVVEDRRSRIGEADGAERRMAQDGRRRARAGRRGDGATGRGARPAGDLETRVAEEVGSLECSRRGDGAESPESGRRCRVAGEQQVAGAAESRGEGARVSVL